MGAAATSGRGGSGQRAHPLSGECLGEPHGLAAGLADVGVVEQSVDGGGGQRLGHQLIEPGRVKVRADRDGAVLVGGVDEPVEPFSGMDRIGERLIESGRWYDALQVGLAATSAEPLRESAQRLLVRVHLVQGNVAEAIRQYRSYAELLRVELNGRPSQGIRDILEPFVGGATA